VLNTQNYFPCVFLGSADSSQIFTPDFFLCPGSAVPLFTWKIMAYVNDKGKYQVAYSKMYKDLIPESGHATTTEGELLRATNNAYAAFVNDGTKFPVWWRKHQSEYAFSSREKDVFIQFQPEYHLPAEYDKMMDHVIEYILASFPEYSEMPRVRSTTTTRGRKRKYEEDQEEESSDNEEDEILCESQSSSEDFSDDDESYNSSESSDCEGNSTESSSSSGEDSASFTNDDNSQ